MRGQGEYIAAVILTMIIVFIAILATNWARYIENVGRMQVVNIVKNKERLTIIWPYEDDKSKALIVNQWDGNSEIKGILVLYNQNPFLKIINISSYNNTYLSIADLKILDLRDIGFNSSMLNNIDRICIITAYSNIFCNEYIPVKTIIPENINFNIFSSPLKVYVSSYDIASPMLSKGWLRTAKFGLYCNRGDPAWFGGGDAGYSLSPYLPKVPVALVYSNGTGVYYADADKKNFTAVIQYDSYGNPSLVSAYLNGDSYTPQKVFRSGGLYIVDGIPFRVIDNYRNGVITYRADVYYAYVSSNKTVYRVYIVSYPVKMDPFDVNALSYLVRNNYNNIIMMSPILFVNYTLYTPVNGSLKLYRLVDPTNYDNYIDLSSNNILLSKDILTIPIITANQSTVSTKTYTAIWRDTVRNDMGITSFMLYPLGQGVWGNIVELDYVRIVAVYVYWVGWYTTTTIYNGDAILSERADPGSTSFYVDPLQWIIMDDTQKVISSFTFRFALPIVLDPDRISGYVVNNMGYNLNSVSLYGAWIRFPIHSWGMWYAAYVSGVTKTFTTSLFTMTTALPNNARQLPPTDSYTSDVWVSILHVDGGLIWLDYEYIDDSLCYTYIKWLYKYPLHIVWQTPTTIQQPTVSGQTLSYIPQQQDVYLIIGGIPKSSGEPWQQDVFFEIEGIGIPLSVTYVVNKLVWDGSNWVYQGASTITTVVEPYVKNIVGTQQAGVYNYWIVQVAYGGVTRQAGIGNFKTPPAITQTITTVYTTTIPIVSTITSTITATSVVPTTITSTIGGTVTTIISTVTQTLTSTTTITVTVGRTTTTITSTSISTSYIPPPGWGRPIYFSIYNQDTLYMVIYMSMVLFIAIIKIWKKIK